MATLFGLFSGLRRRRFRFAVGAVLLFFCAGMGFLPTPGLTHGVYIFAWTDGGRLCTESYFSRSSKVRGGEVRVQDARGGTLFSGTTESAGSVCFPAPEQAQELLFIVNAGQGHRAEFVLPETSVAEAVAALGNRSVSADPVAPPAAPAPPGKASGVFPAASEISGGEPAKPLTHGDDAALELMIRQTVREELRRELAPLRKSLAEQEIDGTPGVKDIVGGLGWIAGLFGLAALYAARRKKS